MLTAGDSRSEVEKSRSPYLVGQRSDDELRSSDRLPESGEYACCEWQEHRQRLVLTRDLYGVRPLWYARLESGVLFSNSMPDLLTALHRLGRRVEPDPLRIADAVMTRYDDRERTFVDGVRAVPPGATLAFDGPAWTPATLSQRVLDSDGPATTKQHDELVDEFRSLLLSAVRSRIRPGSTGVQLSGGLDSSALAGAARDALPSDTIPAYSMSFDAVPACDESSYVRAMAKAGGFDVRWLPADAHGPLEWAQQFASLAAAPMLAGNTGFNIAMQRAAAADGVQVLVDGFDGDSTVSHGAHHLRTLARTWRLLELRQGAAAVAGLHGTSARHTYWSYLRVWGLGSRIADLPHGSEVLELPGRIARRFGHRRPFDRRGLLRAEFVEHVRSLRADTSVPAPGLGSSTERAIHVASMTRGVLTHTLETLDPIARHSGITPVYPFFDEQLVELCVSAPVTSKIGRGYTRLMMRDALDGLVPTEVQWRPTKSNMGPNFVRGLMLLDRERVLDVLSAPSSSVSDIFEIDTLRSVYLDMVARYDSGGAEAVVNEPFLPVYHSLSMVAWLEAIERRAFSPLIG